MYIKQMHLCDTKHRNSVDLRDYKSEIAKCVRLVMPCAQVEVSEKYYTIISHESQTYEEAVSIGKYLGQTDLGKFTKTHLYTCGKTGRMRVSNKIFIEVKKPKGKIIIDDGKKERNLREALKEICEDRPNHEPYDFNAITREEPPCEDSEPLSANEKREIENVLADMSQDSPIQAQQPLADVPIDELEASVPGEESSADESGDSQEIDQSA